MAPLAFDFPGFVEHQIFDLFSLEVSAAPSVCRQKRLWRLPDVFILHQGAAVANQGPRALRAGGWLGAASDSSAGKDMGCVWPQLSGKGWLGLGYRDAGTEMLATSVCGTRARSMEVSVLHACVIYLSQSMQL